MNVRLIAWLTVMQDAYETELANVAAANMLYDLGYSLRAVAGALGVSHEWVRQHLVSNFVDVVTPLSTVVDSDRGVYDGRVKQTPRHTGGQ